VVWCNCLAVASDALHTCVRCALLYHQPAAGAITSTL